MNAPLHAYRMPELPLLVAREETFTALEPETVSDWQVVHRRMTELGVEHAGHERDKCRWLLAADRLSVFARAGYGSLGEYAERILGLSGRQTEERLRVGRALAGLPALESLS